YQLAVAVRDQEAADYCRELIQSSAFAEASSDQRLTILSDGLLKQPKAKTQRPKADEVTWVPADRAVRVTLKSSGKQSVLSLKDRDASAFAKFIADRIEDLYE